MTCIQHIEKHVDFPEILRARFKDLANRKLELRFRIAQYTKIYLHR